MGGARFEHRRMAHAPPLVADDHADLASRRSSFGAPRSRRPGSQVSTDGNPVADWVEAAAAHGAGQHGDRNFDHGGTGGGGRDQHLRLEDEAATPQLELAEQREWVHAKSRLAVAQSKTAHPVDEEARDADRVEPAARHVGGTLIARDATADDDGVGSTLSCGQERGHVPGAMLAIAVERDDVSRASTPGLAESRPQGLALAEPSGVADDLGAGLGGARSARIARAVIDDEHGRVTPRTRHHAGDGRLLVEHRDDDPGRHGPTTSATWLPPRATPWTRLGLPLARAASAAATTPSAPAPAWAPMRWRSAERRS